MYQLTNRPAETASCFERAAKEFESLVSSDPLDNASILSLAQLRVNWGYVLVEEGRAEQAVDALNPSIAALESLHRREPSLALARDRLLRSFGAKAQFLERLGRHAEAAKAWERVVALDQDPSRSINRPFLAMALARGGEPARAVAEVEQLSARPEQSLAQLHYFACVCVRAASAVFGDTSQSPGERTAVAEAYAARAVELLARAAQTIDVTSQRREYLDKLKTESDLEMLQNRADFRRLVSGGTMDRAGQLPSTGRQ
jgi:tetratricopeptide (TPR) repeat protein